jgi:uncharacterized protein
MWKAPAGDAFAGGFFRRDIMITVAETALGRFCWLDLAATDAAEAKTFYRRLFGWTAIEQHANGGVFTRLAWRDRDVGSIYQMDRRLADKVASHWTPYVRVQDVEVAARQAAALGGQVLIRPFAVSGVARIALIMDSVGAQVGLWEPIASMGGEEHDQEDG